MRWASSADRGSPFRSCSTSVRKVASRRPDPRGGARARAVARAVATPHRPGGTAREPSRPRAGRRPHSRARALDMIRRDFVANVSHELKTPIGALTLLAEAVAEAADDPAAVERFSSRMRMESERLGRLVQQIIELSRLQGDDPLEHADVVPVNVIADTGHRPRRRRRRRQGRRDPVRRRARAAGPRRRRSARSSPSATWSRTPSPTAPTVGG